MTVSDTPSVDGDLEYGLTEFDQKLRHHCRYLKCRSRLPTPVVNHREAFCARGCHSAFYRHRCRVCEGPIERKASNQMVCRKAKCRSALKAGLGFGRYHPTSDAKQLSEKPVNKGQNRHSAATEGLPGPSRVNRARILAPCKVLDAVFGPIPVCQPVLPLQLAA